MDQEIKDEAQEQVRKDVLMGFDTKEEIFEGVMDMFYDNDDFDEAWLTAVIDDAYAQHQAESKRWTTPTDFDRLVKVFDQLMTQQIVCLHKAGYTRQDAMHDCMEVVNALAQYGVNALGYCYYHTQDVERVIDPETKNLLLGFDSSDSDEEKALAVGVLIAEILEDEGFEFAWNGTINQRIEIKNLNWQKVPTDEDYGLQRNLRLFGVV